MLNSERWDALGSLFAGVGFLQSVGLRQLHPCWPGDALHLMALPREPLPCSALMSPWKKDVPHHLWSLAQQRLQAGHYREPRK